MTKSETAVKSLLKDTFVTVTSGPGLPPYMKIVFRDLDTAQKAHNMLIEAGFELDAFSESSISRNSVQST